MENANQENIEKQAEYIKALELSVKILQKEVDSLRELASKAEAQNDPVYSQLDLSLIDYSEHTIDNIYIKLINNIENFYPIYDSNIFYLDNKSVLKPIFNKMSSFALTNKFEKIQEEGILDWAFQQEDIKIIPDLYGSNQDSSLQILIIPQINGKRKFFFGAMIKPEKLVYNNTINLSLLLTFASALQNINLINKENKIVQLSDDTNHLENYILNKISILSNSFHYQQKLENIIPGINVVKGNLGLIAAGAGNVETRISLIEKELNKIESFSKIENEARNGNQAELSEIIQEIILELETQLETLGINIDYKSEVEEFELKVDINNFKFALINMILTLAKDMPDAKIISVSTRIKKDKLILSIIDDNTYLVNDNILRSNLSEANIDIHISKLYLQSMNAKVNFIFGEEKGRTIKIIIDINNE